jgi:Rrf2 family nitric oxide-sensitive transcriptional repressor
MQLALQTDYALRTLIYLAHKSQRVTIAEISNFYGISNAHVAKVVNQLARRGFLRSIRGIGGGLEIKQAPADIRVGDVIQAMEGNTHLLECVDTGGVCIIEKFCKLKRVLAQAETLQMDYLNSVSIADILPTVRQVTQLEELEG